MLFDSQLRSFRPFVAQGVREFIKTALRNQTHEGDGFLVAIHGFFQEEIDEARKKPGSLKLSPYVFGPGHAGWEEQHASNEFYSVLRANIIEGDRSKYYEYYKTCRDWEREWRISVQLEMYMYLKFWESDLILKKLTQLARLCNREYYKWELTFKQNYKRGEWIENKVINKIKDICPHFHNVISSVYDRELRNAIAHSQYFFMGDRIILTNESTKSRGKRRNIRIGEWDELICKFVLFYDLLNYYVGYLERAYRRRVGDGHFGQQVRIIEKGDAHNQKIEWIRSFDDGRWIWYKTWEEYYQPRLNIV